MKTVPNVRRQRRGAVDLQQVGPVDVAELGRHDAVDQPREEDDLGGVLRPDAHPRAAQQERPALAAQREAEVEDRERQQDEDGVRGEDETGHDLSSSPLSATKTAMTATGTAIEMIVRGWRMRRARDICSASGSRSRSVVTAG